MARILDTRESTDGMIREVELQTASKRKIRRPVNLLVPLELNDDMDSHASNEINKAPAQVDNATEISHRGRTYNLRPRLPVRYSELEINCIQSSIRPRVIQKILFHIMILILLVTGLNANPPGPQMTCVDGGVLNMDDLQNELRHAKKTLKDLRDAIPPLPEVDDLYDRVTLKCKEFRECTLAMTNLETRIKQLRLSKATWSERYQQLQLLEITVDKIRVEFLFVRTQLRTLFALPPLMIALKKMKPHVWDTLIETPQVDEHDKPIITEQKTIEKVTADQLQVLEGYRSILATIRSSLNEEKKEDESRFEDDMRQSIHLLQTSILREIRALSSQNPPAYAEDDRAQPR
ncbi:hypothetical protein Aduo_015378 [Ancylostoma duodenale]